jgi:NAD(P)-dependent dehydrogenase (short-subunit alcohol dehydrogenase family)
MKSIFITGAAKGIGKATARLFAQKDWFVGLYDTDETGVAELHKEIGAEKSCFAKLDVRNETEIKNAVEHFAKFTNGKMDVLLNNAGVLEMGFFEKIPLEKQKRMIDINFWGVVATTFMLYHCLKIQLTRRLSIFHRLRLFTAYPNFVCMRLPNTLSEVLQKAWKLNLNNTASRFRTLCLRL